MKAIADNLVKKFSLVKGIKDILFFMKRSGVRARFFTFSLLLSIGVTLFNLYSVSLLFPLVNGIIANNFNNVTKIQLVGTIIRHFPHIFSSSVRIFIFLVIWLYATIIIKNLLQYSALLTTQHQAKKAGTWLRQVLLERCLGFGKRFFDNRRISEIRDILIDSSTVIDSQFKLLQTFLLVIVNFGIMVWISWKLTLIACIVFPIVNMLTRKIIRSIREQVKLAKADSLALSDKVFNIIFCMPLVKGFAKEKKEKIAFEVVSNKDVEQTFKTNRLLNLVSPIEDIGSTTGTLLIALGMAFLFHIDHGLDATGSFIFIYLATRIIPGLNSINDFELGVAQASADVAQIDSILLDDPSQHIVIDGRKDFSGLKEGIELRDLRFAYSPENGDVLKGVSLFIEKGKITALVGPTGSGKSTIGNLLLRFYDCPPNSIFVDGVDIRDYKSESLRRHMSFVGQDVMLFNDTIRNNIVYASDSPVSEEYLRSVAEKAFVHKFVSKFPDSYDTIVGEHGVRLSGGEKQRLSIARAMIKGSDILILDEATSAMDSRTEESVVEAINDMHGGKTILLISHRHSMLRKADKIAYVDDGRIVEQGTLEELIAKKGAFYAQWQSQRW